MSRDKKILFSFVLDELEPIRPVVKRAFGFTYVYLDGKLLCGLRESVKLPSCNGLWLFTSIEHLDSLGREFPALPRRRSGRKAWVILASRLEFFEEYAFKACELMLNGDRRVGRVDVSKKLEKHGQKRSGNGAEF